MKRILIIGRNGQVSENLIDLLKSQDKFEFKILGMSELDLSRPQQVYPILNARGYKPDVIINAAAYTAVDNAEDEREACDNINNISVREIAKFAKKNRSLLIHYSTDYVYDGAGNQPFSEVDEEKLKPLNHYGVTKLAGENEIIKSGCDYLILRTSWVYNHSGKNFVLTMLKLAAERDELKIINDQIGSPTYAYDIAHTTLKLIPKFKRSGIYHFVPPEKISWYEFTNLIISQAKGLGFPVKAKNILPIKTSEYPTKAIRPLNSRLSTDKLQRDFGLQLPSLQESLTSCLKRIRSRN